MRVVDLLQSLRCLLRVYGILLGTGVSTAQITFLEIRIAALDNLADAVVRDRLMKDVFRGIRRLTWTHHFSALVRVEREVKVLGDDTALGDIVEVDLSGIEDEVFSGNREATGD